MPKSPYERQREDWIESHPEWPADKELPWPPPYDVPEPLAEPEGQTDLQRAIDAMRKAETQNHAQRMREMLSARSAFFGLERLFAPNPFFDAAQADGGFMTKFAPEPTKAEAMALQRELALLDGEGKIEAGDDCNHGTRGYALLHLEWSGHMRKQLVETGPLPIDRHLRFTLTALGLGAQAELLALKTPKAKI